MRILVAPNAFKNSLAAADVAEAIRAGLKKANFNALLIAFLLAMAVTGRQN